MTNIIDLQAARIEREKKIQRSIELEECLQSSAALRYPLYVWKVLVEHKQALHELRVQRSW